ncbi:APC family permease [Hymenobacter qilianensis]|uniref:APC family permease n=1 Tax=Hymenobacter qilianensis TaxID=1385715 RepID=UPI0021D3E33B|nr:amino acid permease [Hymenobacter qilianensis]
MPQLDSAKPPTLRRDLGLVQATALNMIDMVGIGPFVVLPLVMHLMGPYFLLAWMVGAALAVVDGMVWAELGAAYPEAGGSYRFLKLAYGEAKWGRLMSFLYVWQTLVQAPLVVASGAIGFAQYFGYLVPLTEWWQPKLVSGVVVLALIVLLYRRIDDIGRLGVLLWVGVLGLMGWLIFGGVTHSTHNVAWLPMGAFRTCRACCFRWLWDRQRSKPSTATWATTTCVIWGAKSAIRSALFRAASS